MGIKGGIARKLLKHLYGTPEPPGSFDIDVLVFIDQYTPTDRKAARELVTGMRLGGLVLEAKDVEVMTKVSIGCLGVAAAADGDDAVAMLPCLPQLFASNHQPAQRACAEHKSVCGYM